MLETSFLSLQHTGRLPPSISTKILDYGPLAGLTTAARLRSAIYARRIPALANIRTAGDLIQAAHEWGEDNKYLSIEPVSAKDLFLQAAIHARDTGLLLENPALDRAIRAGKLVDRKDVPGADKTINCLRDFHEATAIAIKADGVIKPLPPAHLSVLISFAERTFNLGSG